MQRQLLTIVSLLAASLTCAAQADTGAVRRDHVTVELVTLEKVVQPGATFNAGLRLAHDPEWHTYWVNPGDSGLQTKLHWTLPEGVSASDIAWPAPHRIDLGPITNFGYEGEMVLPVQLTLPSTVKPGTQVPLQVKASWLICKEECIPGDATLNTDVSVGSAPVIDSRWQALFNAAQQAQPMATTWKAQWAERGDDIVMSIDDAGVIADLKNIQMFPQSPTLIAHAGYKIERSSSGTLSIVGKKSDNFETPDADIPIVLAEGRGSGRHVFQFQLPQAASAAIPVSQPTAAATHVVPQQSVALAFVLALVGGMLLNLMPCVLPVLSLKALALAEHSHDRAQARRHGILYFAGTLTCFVALAAVLLVLRAAGEALGWGFQLQVPWVVATLAMLMTVMGLSLSGVFELGSSWMGFGQSFTEGSSGRSAFFSGALAAIVASPCTAPFMGPALGFAITQPVPVALGVFIALATGLALPIVVLSFAPMLGRWLPRPGAWMERFKQVLAYPMYLTAIWLLWVLGRQLGADGMALTLLAVTALVFGLWLWQTSTGRWFGKTAAAISVAVAAVVVFSLPHAPEATAAARVADASQTWRPWSAKALGELRAQGKPVLVNMTAAWCITCLANERVALSSSAVQNSIKSLGVAYLKGDWTNRDTEITEYLAHFGRNGVPLYVVYPDGEGEPEVLPQLLTPDIVQTALERAAKPDRVAHSLP